VVEEFVVEVKVEDVVVDEYVVLDVEVVVEEFVVEVDEVEDVEVVVVL